MSSYATITITTGPSRGEVFQLNEEVIHLGKGPENHIDVDDPEITEQQASIVNRNGRFAIYTPLEQTIEVDGSLIPSDRWVWLPDVARVKISSSTSFQFNTAKPEAKPSRKSPGARQPRPNAPPDGPKDPTRRRKRSKKGAPKKRKDQQLAKFITDEGGDTLVKLGEDGHLPELQLAEGGPRKKPQKVKQQNNSTNSGLFILLGFSVLSSCGLMLMDFEPSKNQVKKKKDARISIREFYPQAGREPRLFEEYLLEARFAHSRGDRRNELAAYRKVLRLLDAEDLNQISGLSGDTKRDERLRELIATIMSK